jgi:hypothetical protein
MDEMQVHECEDECECTKNIIKKKLATMVSFFILFLFFTEFDLPYPP